MLVYLLEVFLVDFKKAASSLLLFALGSYEALAWKKDATYRGGGLCKERLNIHSNAGLSCLFLRKYDQPCK